MATHNERLEAERLQQQLDRAALDGTGQIDIDQLANKAFKDSASVLEKAEIGKTTKVFGMDIDSGLIAYVASVNNLVADYVQATIAPQIDKFITKTVGPKLNIEGKALSRTSAAVTLGVAVALKAGKDTGVLLSAMSAQRKDRAKLVHGIAPVLDDIKGKHSVGAFNSVTEAQNEVIYAHRQRMAKIAHTTNLGNVISLGVNAGFNLLTDIRDFHMMWGSDKNKVEAIKQRKLEDKAEKEASNDATGMDGKHLVRMLLNTTTGQVADRIQKTNEVKLRNTLQPYSALEMILELNKQVESDPKASSYSMPRSFHQPNKQAASFPLEEYLIHIFRQHQKDMSDLSPDHTEIRDALKSDLAAAVKPIAKAIREGDMTAMALARLVGEGKIIRNRGRAIISAHEVELMLEKEAPKQLSAVHMDSKKYFENASFTHDDNKALKTLQGTERLMTAAWEPDEVLLESGYSKAEIKEVRDWAAKQIADHPVKLTEYDKSLGEALLGAHHESDEQLRKMGSLAEKEIIQLHAAGKKLEEKGIEAIAELKMGPRNENGIERPLSNLAVNSVKSDKTYLGTIRENGRKRFEAMISEGGDAAVDTKAPNTMTKYTKNGFAHSGGDLADGSSGSHARREEHRAAHAHDTGHHRD